MTERLDLPHDLPEDIADALSDDLRTVGTLYNDIQDLSEEAFKARFGDALDTLQAVDPDADFVIVVLGLGVDVGEGPLVDDAALVSVHEPNDDGSVARLFYTGDAAPGDTFLMIPLRPGDCPPDTGGTLGTLSLPEFREIVSAMTFKRFDLLENDLDSYRDSYLRPAVRGLEAYAERCSRN